MILIPQGHLEVAKWLFSVGAAEDVRTKDNDARTPMSVACQKGHLHVAKWLFLKDAGDDIRTKDEIGTCPMDLACAGGHLDVAQWLFSVGPKEEMLQDCRAKDIYGLSPLTRACLQGQLDIAKWLVGAGLKLPQEVGSNDARRGLLAKVLKKKQIGMVQWLYSEGIADNEEGNLDPIVLQGIEAHLPMRVRNAICSRRSKEKRRAAEKARQVESEARMAAMAEKAALELLAAEEETEKPKKKGRKRKTRKGSWGQAAAEEASCVQVNLKPGPVISKTIDDKQKEQVEECRYCFGYDLPLLVQCPRCAAARYCSHACMEAHWKEGHEFVCIPVAGLEDADNAGSLQKDTTTTADQTPTEFRSAGHDSRCISVARRAPSVAPVVLLEEPKTIASSSPALANDYARKSTPPLELLCPIAHVLFVDPVVASDGETYERESIQRWIDEKKAALADAQRELQETGNSERAKRIIAAGVPSPMGHGALRCFELYPARMAKRLTESWLEKLGGSTGV